MHLLISLICFGSLFYFRRQIGGCGSGYGSVAAKGALTLLVLLVMGLPAMAQQAWSLADCLAFSRKNNLAIQQQHFERGKNQLRLNASKRKFLPVVDSRWRSASNWGFLIDPSTNGLEHKFNFGNQFSLNANWDLFNGSASSHQTKVYSQELKAAEYSYESAVNTAALEVIYLYLQVLLSAEQHQGARQRVQQLKNQQDQVSRQVAKGVLNKRDLLNMESLLAAEDLNGVLAANNLEKARFTLMQTIGLRQDSLIQVAPMAVSDSLLAAGYRSMALPAVAEERFPEVKAAQSRVEAAQAGVLVVRNSKLPVLSLSSQLASRTSSAQEVEFNRQVQENLNKQIGLNFTIPIFNNHVTQANIDIAQLELESARVTYRQIREEVRQKILSATLDYKAAYRRFGAAQVGLQALKEEFRFAEKQLQLGLINAIAFGEVRSRFFAAQSQLLQDRYDCFFKWKILQYYQGQPLY
jgi:outer membrane protein